MCGSRGLTRTSSLILSACKIYYHTIELTELDTDITDVLNTKETDTTVVYGPRSGINTHTHQIVQDEDPKDHLHEN